MTEQEMQKRIEQLEAENKKLKAEIKKVKDHNNKLLNSIEVYHRFVSGGALNG